MTERISGEMAGLNAEIAALRERLAHEGNPDFCPNLRDYYPDRDACNAAVLAWHTNVDAIKAALNEAVGRRHAPRKTEGSR